MRYLRLLAAEGIKDLGKLRAHVRAAVRDAMEKHLRLEPTKTSKIRIKRLRGVRRPQYRLRVDETRIFYDVSERVVEVLAIIPKSQASSWLEQWGESQ